MPRRRSNKKSPKSNNKGGSGVSTGLPAPTELPDVLKEHFGDDNAQNLSGALGKWEEEIPKKNDGSDYKLRQRRRNLIMTLPTSEGWTVMNHMMQAGTRHASQQTLHDNVETLVSMRWGCLKAGKGPINIDLIDT